jgi:hypothetical protein
MRTGHAEAPGARQQRAGQPYNARRCNAAKSCVDFFHIEEQIRIASSDLC